MSDSQRDVLVSRTALVEAAAIGFRANPHTNSYRKCKGTCMRLTVAQVFHETATFSSVPTTREVFTAREWHSGASVADFHRGNRTYIGGILARAQRLNLELSLAFSTSAYPSGTISRETLREIEHEFLTTIQDAGKSDGILLVLHGAGVTENQPDLEGHLLRKLRDQVGPDIPIIATLDLHANITEDMVTNATALLGVHLYPHTDMYERGEEAVETMVRVLAGDVEPVTHFIKLPLVIPTTTTNHGLAADINRLCWELEAMPGVLDGAFIHGFPYTDTDHVGAAVLVTTNRRPELAQEVAIKVAKYFWSNRDRFYPTPIGPAEGLALAMRSTKQPVVMNETSDNPGGGAPGDGSRLLKPLLELDVPSTCFGYICDPEVARLAHSAGTGATIRIMLGGKVDSLHGEPVCVEAYVKCLTDGRFIQSSPMGAGTRIDLGPSCRLVIGSVDVIVCSVRSQTLDEQLFLLHGIDVQKYRIVALKSSQHFRASFEQIAGKILTVDGPGLTTLDLRSFTYYNLPEPSYPFQEVPDDLLPWL